MVRRADWPPATRYFAPLPSKRHPACARGGEIWGEKALTRLCRVCHPTTSSAPRSRQAAGGGVVGGRVGPCPLPAPTRPTPWPRAPRGCSVAGGGGATGGAGGEVSRRSFPSVPTGIVVLPTRHQRGSWRCPTRPVARRATSRSNPATPPARHGGGGDRGTVGAGSGGAGGSGGVGQAGARGGRRRGTPRARKDCLSINYSAVILAALRRLFLSSLHSASGWRRHTQPAPRAGECAPRRPLCGRRGGRLAARSPPAGRPPCWPPPAHAPSRVCRGGRRALHPCGRGGAGGGVARSGLSPCSRWGARRARSPPPHRVPPSRPQPGPSSAGRLRPRSGGRS